MDQNSDPLDTESFENQEVSTDLKDTIQIKSESFFQIPNHHENTKDSNQKSESLADFAKRLCDKIVVDKDMKSSSGVPKMREPKSAVKRARNRICPVPNCTTKSCRGFFQVPEVMIYCWGFKYSE